METSNIESLNEIIEELEESNTKEELIVKKKHQKKKASKLINKTLLSFIIINIFLIPIIYILFTIYNDNIPSPKNNYEMSDKTEDKNKLSNLNFKIKHVIENTNNYTKFGIKKTKFPIESVAQFPSGTILSADWVSIDIYDNNFNIKQKINVFDIIDERKIFKSQKKIYKIEIQDENNFAIYANDGTLQVYSKEGEDYVLKHNIENEEIIDVIFDSKGRMITCSRDDYSAMKVYEKNEKGEYKAIRTITYAYNFDVLLLEDKNLLIARDLKTIDFYDITQKYKHIHEIYEKSVHGLERLGDDKIITYRNNTLKIISIKEYKVIKTVNIGFQAYAIKYCKERDIIFAGGCYSYGRGYEKSILSIYRGDNFELIKSIEDIHDTCVKGISLFKDGSFATYGDDYDNGYPIKIWTLE